MKNLKLNIAGVILAITFCTTNVIDQSINKNDVPANVLTAFTTKYPKADIKNWQVADNEYTVKIKEDGHKCYVSFDKDGNWLRTTSKFNWPWHLTPVVKKAFKDSEFGGWHIYGVNIIETHLGKFYQVLVDDANHPIDASHQEIFTENRIIEFKSTGEVVKTEATRNMSAMN